MQSVSGLRQQNGFTLIEVMVAIFIGLIVMSAVAATIWSNKDDTNVSMVKQFMIKDAPTALTSYMIRNGDADGVSRTDLVERGLKEQTEWDSNWSVSGPNSGVVTITYPLTGASDMADTGTDLASSLNEVGGSIDSASFSSPNLIVGIRVQ